jgi:hypothetical protein
MAVVETGMVEDGVGLSALVAKVVEVGVRTELLAGSLDPQERIKIIITAARIITIRIIAISLPLPFITHPPFKSKNKHKILCQNVNEYRIFTKVRKL